MMCMMNVKLMEVMYFVLMWSVCDILFVQAVDPVEISLSL